MDPRRIVQRFRVKMGAMSLHLSTLDPASLDSGAAEQVASLGHMISSQPNLLMAEKEAIDAIIVSNTIFPAKHRATLLQIVAKNFKCRRNL